MSVDRFDDSALIAGYARREPKRSIRDMDPGEYVYIHFPGDPDHDKVGVLGDRTADDVEVIFGDRRRLFPWHRLAPVPFG